MNIEHAGRAFEHSFELLSPAELVVLAGNQRRKIQLTCGPAGLGRPIGWRMLLPLRMNMTMAATCMVNMDMAAFREIVLVPAVWAVDVDRGVSVGVVVVMSAAWAVHVFRGGGVVMVLVAVIMPAPWAMHMFLLRLDVMMVLVAVVMSASRSMHVFLLGFGVVMVIMSAAGAVDMFFVRFGLLTHGVDPE
jgi:hypothetical protein